MQQPLVCVNLRCIGGFRGNETPPFVFLPPPPPRSSSHSSFSPALTGIIGILVLAFILVSYYTIFAKYCASRNALDRRRGRLASTDGVLPLDTAVLTVAHGLDEAVIEAIPIFKYIRGDGLIEVSDCAVCLSEFQENESLRLLPKCSHAFHISCIDEWLHSHSSCPLCRANIISPPSRSTTSPPVLDPISQDPSLLQQENHRHDPQSALESNPLVTSEDRTEENVKLDRESLELQFSLDHLHGQSYTRSFSLGSISTAQKQAYLDLKRSCSLGSSNRHIVVEFVRGPEQIDDTVTNCRSERQTEPSSMQGPGSTRMDLNETRMDLNAGLSKVVMEIPTTGSSSTQMTNGNPKSKSFHLSTSLRSKAYDLSRGKVLSLKRSFSGGRIFSFIGSRRRNTIGPEIDRPPI